MLFVFAVMLAVFALILVVFAVILAVFEVMLAVFAFTFVFNVAMLFVFAVMLDVLDAILVSKVEMVDALTPPTLLTVVAKLPLPEPVTSPVKVVVKFAAITSVPMANPKFVLAAAAVDAPVPPFVIAIVPLIFAEVKLLSATPAFALCKST